MSEITVRNLQIANNVYNRCLDCPHIKGHIEYAIEYCNHPDFMYALPVIDDINKVLDECPLKKEL